MTPSSSDDSEATIVLNPVSGSGEHVEAVRERALLAGYDVEETGGPGDAVDLARTAAERGSTLIAAAGGDGTLNEVVRGVLAADALDRVTVGVVPVGTGNNFAGNVGVADLDDAFGVLEHGERRRLDLGTADDRPFVNSCVGGVTADASGETTPEMKSRLGVLAYVVNTVQTVTDFDGLRLAVDLWRDGRREHVWSGDAIAVLVGNCRRFSVRGDTQANVEDGLLDVAIVEDAPATELVEEALVERLFGADSPHTVRLFASSLELAGHEGTDPIDFSLDGEMVRRTRLELGVRERSLSVAVGDDYDPDPDHGPRTA